MRLCRELGALYIDTVVEPWPGFYFDRKAGPEARTNNALRNTVREEKAKNPGGTTAVSCCGANPGMVSWFVKQALVDIARDTGHAFTEPGADDREGWARLMRDLGVKGVHIAERDTQRSRNPKPMDVFVNTWSVEGFISEGLQPAELGWGTHEKWLPENGRLRDDRTEGRRLPAPARRQHARPHLVPDAGRPIRLPRHPQRVDLDRRLLHRARGRHGRLPADLPLRLSPGERRRAVAARDVRPAPARRRRSTTSSTRTRSSTASTSSACSLYGHAKNAYWYGSQLSIEETRDLAPYQNATGLQVTSAVLAGMVWALENPEAGIVETDEMDYRRCLEGAASLSRPGQGLLHRLDAA